MGKESMETTKGTMYGVAINPEKVYNAIISLRSACRYAEEQKQPEKTEMITVTHEQAAHICSYIATIEAKLIELALYKEKNEKNVKILRV